MWITWVPFRCCGRKTEERPLLFYWTTLSPYHPARVEFSLVMLTRNGARIQGLEVLQLPHGARVEVRCRGRSCHFSKKVRTHCPWPFCASDQIRPLMKSPKT